MAVADESQKNQSSHFDIVLRGYNQRQVNERVTRLGYDLKNAAKSRDEAVAQVAELSKALNYAQQELSDTKARLERMAMNPSSATAMTERVREMMRLADEEVSEIRRTADDGVHVHHDLTQEELAQLVGASRETVNKALADFASRGWLRLEPRSVVIMDVERMKRRAR